ncbi:MAG: site-2 protease family protein [Balneolaceae bacterium]
MNTSLNLGKIAGIKVQIHWTFWLLILFVIFFSLSGDGTAMDIFWSTGFILVLFACVVLHEFGHALTAKRYGVGTRSITLLPIGGVASLNKMPEDPKAEFMVAIAGPAVNIAIAFLLYLAVPMETFLNQDPGTLENELSTITRQNFLFYLFFANTALVLFNMLPAFPLDGGRMLRALLSVKMGRVQATRTAAMLGKFLALGLFLTGLYYNFILSLIAVFIYFGAESEKVMVTQLKLLEGNVVEDAMITRFTTLTPGDTLDDVVDIILKSPEKDFVVAGDTGVQGIILMSDLARFVREMDGKVQVKHVMDREFKILNPGDTLTVAYREIRKGRGSLFPVLENDKLVGVIDMNNIDEFIKFRAPLDH